MNYIEYLDLKHFLINIINILVINLTFIKFCSVSEIEPGTMKMFEYKNTKILLINLNDKYFALSGICTHEYCELDKGFLIGDYIKCPLHLSEFEVQSGQVQTPPATESLKKYNVKIIDSFINIECV